MAHLGCFHEKYVLARFFFMYSGVFWAATDYKYFVCLHDILLLLLVRGGDFIWGEIPGYLPLCMKYCYWQD